MMIVALVQFIPPNSLSSAGTKKPSRQNDEAKRFCGLGVGGKLESGRRLSRKTDYAIIFIIALDLESRDMGVRIKVPCNCWERGLCTPWPYDPAALDPPTEDRDFLTVKDEFTKEFYQRFDEWRDTACEHGGWAYDRKLGSNGFVRRLEEDVRKITGSTTAVEDMLFSDILECVNKFAMWRNDTVECEILIEEIDELLATGKVPEVVPPDRDSTKQGLLWIREAAVASVMMQKKLAWG
jgi:hypothetical protein